MPCGTQPESAKIRSRVEKFTGSIRGPNRFWWNVPSSRVVSLIASATETVVALGCEDRLVARSHECDYPASVQGLPVCTAPRINIHAGSAEIDRQVKSMLADAVSIYSV